MRDHSGYIEKDRHEAMQDVLDAWEFERAVERVTVPEALGRVAAADVVSLNELPNKLTSNMDGIAVRFDAFEAAAPGISDTSAWRRGVDWQFCNTGIAMPDPRKGPTISPARYCRRTGVCCTTCWHRVRVVIARVRCGMARRLSASQVRRWEPSSP